jgi:hypothetical protein
MIPYNPTKIFDLPIRGIADSLETRIKLYIEKNNLKSVNIYFICHSMGGIIAKEFICSYWNKQEYTYIKYYSINVPHKGSDFAILKDSIVDSAQLRELKPNSDTLKRQNEQWMKINKHRLPYTIYFIGDSDLVVDKNSAISEERRTKSKDYDIYNYSGDHSDFLKPLSNNIVLTKISIDLCKADIIDIKQKIVKEKEKEITEGYIKLETISPECLQTACLFPIEETIVKISNYVLLFNSFEEIDKMDLKVEIEYILKTVRLYLEEPKLLKELGSFDFKRFKYEEVYKHVFNYISNNLLDKCTCSVNNRFEELKEELRNEFNHV